MHAAPNRRSLLKAGAGLLAAQACLVWAEATEPSHDVTYAEDFDELWRTLAERYCYFGEKRTDWKAVRALYRPQALAAGSRDDFAAVVDRVLGELYDAHTHRGAAADATARLPYYDLWVETWRNGGALVTSVRDASAAADAGIVLGDTITGVDGTSVAVRAAASMPRCLSRPDPAATAYALNVAVSGRRGQPRLLALRSTGGAQSVFLPVKITSKLPDVESRPLPGGYGCIVVRSFADKAVIDAFDAALLRFRDAPGLIIDVRQNGGGDTAVARPIMGRFIADRRPYARMRRREGDHLSEPWTEFVDHAVPSPTPRPSRCSRRGGAPAWPRVSPWVCAGSGGRRSSARQ